MEFVYVVKRRDLFPGPFPHGLDVLEADAMGSVVTRIRARGFFVERRHAEGDPDLKQVIPYCVVNRGDQVFVMRRLDGGGEARLRGKRSIGVGGHVNPVDGGDDVLEAGLRREIEEEIAVEGDWVARPVGLLNDDSTDVGSVHVGLVFAVAVTGEVLVREDDTLVGAFLPISDLRALCRSERASFETWSALVVDQLDAVLAP